jgi:processive 1,2-diacylglycerol beta-glucosyltransferase
MGAGHDGAARELRSRLEADGHEVTVLDFLPCMPWRTGYFIRWFYGMQLAHAPGTYQWHYDHMQSNRFVMALSYWYATWAKRRMARRIRRVRPAVVVSTYPLASQTLGALKAHGRLRVPTVTFMTDFSVHPTWINRHIDLHLTVSPATAADAAAMSGRPALATGPLVPEHLGQELTAGQRRQVRDDLGIAEDAIVALVVAGSWGVGNIAATVRALTQDGHVTPLVVCGRNEVLHRSLQGMPGVVALGWRTDMASLLRASDVLVENAGGLTAMEAFRAGIPVISHECIAGHGTHNAGVMSDSGVVTWVRDAADLVPAVRRLAVETCQSEQASRLFAGDPAVVVGALARGEDLATAVQRSGVAPISIGRPVPASRSRSTVVRRRAGISAVAGLATFYASTAGVAAATGFGVGVTDEQHKHPTEAFVVVRLAATELPASAELSAALRGLDATVAVDNRVVRARPTDLRTLSAAGIMLVNAGSGRVGGLHPGRAHSDLIEAQKALSAITGSTAPAVFVSPRRLSVLDLGTAWFGRDTLVRPDEVLRQGQPITLRGGRIILVDGRGFSRSTLVSELNRLAATLRTQGLSAAPLSTVVEA